MDIFLGRYTNIEPATNTEVPLQFNLPEVEEILAATVNEFNSIEAGKLVTIDGRIVMDLLSAQEI